MNAWETWLPRKKKKRLRIREKKRTSKIDITESRNKTSSCLESEKEAQMKGSLVVFALFLYPKVLSDLLDLCKRCQSNPITYFTRFGWWECGPQIRQNRGRKKKWRGKGFHLFQADSKSLWIILEWLCWVFPRGMGLQTGVIIKLDFKLKFQSEEFVLFQVLYLSLLI